MTDFTMNTDAEGIATITWDVKQKSMNVMTLEAWDDLEALIDQGLGNDAVKGIVITSGKPDSFAGGMMGALAREGDGGVDPTSFEAIHRAVAHGTVVASYNIESFSLDRLASLTNAELEERYQKFASMVRFG